MACAIIANLILAQLLQYLKFFIWTIPAGSGNGWNTVVVIHVSSF